MPEPQQRGIGVASATYTTAHRNARYLTHWVRLEIEPAISWFLVGFISTMPRREVQGCRFDAWPHSMGQGSGFVMSCCVGHSQGLEPVLLWLWHRLASVAPIWPLDWELPYASDVTLKSKEKTKLFLLPLFFLRFVKMWNIFLFSCLRLVEEL